MASHRSNIPDSHDQGPLARLAAMSARLASSGNGGELHELIVEETARLLRADAAALALSSDGKSALHAGPVVGDGGHLVDPAVLDSLPIRETLVRGRQTLRLDHPTASRVPVGDGIASLLAAPLVAGDQLLGVLLLGRGPGSDGFTPQDRQLLEIAAGFSAAALGEAIDFEHFSHDLRGQIVEATRELNHAMAELARVKSFNENIFESISMGIVVFDRSFAVIFRNRVAQQCLAEDRNILDVLGRTNIAERYADFKTIVRDVVRMGQVCGFDRVHYVRGAGDELMLRLALSPLFSGREAIVGGILTVEDITQSVDIRRRLDASERLAAVGRLASKVAHELNNPLDGILRYISLASRVSEGSGDDRPVAYLKEARTGLMRMARIIGELLQFSRSTTQVVEDGLLRTALADAIKSLEGKAAEKGVALGLSIADDVPPLESTSLYQVFTNLVKNAIEATPRDGRVDVEALLAAGAVEVRVADTGPGIPEDKLESVFEPFFSTKQPGQGTGLGLAICKELVEKQGGTIVARNRADGGAEFVVRIPTQWTAGE